MKKTGLRYIAYVRKSTESAERQELSHQAQIAEIKRAFPGLNIIKWMPPESQSAFKPGRPIFDEMMSLIEQGNADAVVSWHPNRLSRNEIDAARVTYGLRGPLKGLKFCSYNFDNSPEGVLMLQFVMSQGQYESASKAKDVRRGMKMKAENGERPGRVWPGYMKVPVVDGSGNPVVSSKDKKIITRTDIDPDRYDTIKQIWDWFLYDRLNPAEIRRRINAAGYKTPLYRRRDGSLGGGIPMPANGVRRILTSSFYFGYIEHEGELYKGSHYELRMIDEQQFDLAQYLLGKRGKPRLRIHEHAFNGLIRCANCDCLVTETVKEKLVKTTGTLKTYRYYGCTHKSVRPCAQKPVSTQELERQIADELGKYELLPEFYEIAMNVLRRQNKTETTGRARTYKTLQEQRANIQSQIDELLTMRTRKLLDDDEYVEQKNRLKLERNAIDGKLTNVSKQADQWTAATERAFDFATNAPERFKHGSLAVKGDILRTLGETLIMKDQKLLIEVSEWLVPIAEHAPELQKRYLYIRKNQKANPKKLELALDEIFTTWRAIWDLNPGHSA